MDSLNTLKNKANNIFNKTGKPAVIIILVTLVSKIIGFVRESVIASNFGATADTDAYVVAVTIYTLVMLIFSEVINNAFMPLYVSSRQKSKKIADKFINTVFSFVLIISIITTIIGLLFAKQIASVFAPGFSEEALQLAANLTRVMLPVIIITGISIVAGGALQSQECFLPQAAMGIPNHIMVILILIIWGSNIGIKGLTAIASIGTASQLLVQLPFLKKRGVKCKLKPHFKMPEVNLFLHSLFPIFIATAARQVITVVDKALASSGGQGSISILNYSNIMYASISGLFITTLTTIMYPQIAKNAFDNELLAKSVKKCIQLLVAVILFISIIVWCFKYEIISIMFERGNFTRNNALDTAEVFMFYSFGLVPAALNDILMKTMYCIKKVKFPMYISIASISVNVILSILLYNLIGIAGLALASSITAFFSMILYIYALKKAYQMFSIDILNDILKIFFAFILPGGASYVSIYAVKNLLYCVWEAPGTIVLAALVAAASAAGLAVYVLMIFLIGFLKRKLYP